MRHLWLGVCFRQRSEIIGQRRYVLRPALQSESSADAEHGTGDRCEVGKIYLTDLAKRHLPVQIAKDGGTTGKSTDQFTFDAAELSTPPRSVSISRTMRL